MNISMEAVRAGVCRTNEDELGRAEQIFSLPFGDRKIELDPGM
jgi:hypothetical protein